MSDIPPTSDPIDRLFAAIRSLREEVQVFRKEIREDIADLRAEMRREISVMKQSNLLLEERLEKLEEQG